MRGVYAICSLIPIALFLYAITSYSAIDMAMRPGSKFNDPLPKPLAEAAPEVIALRPDLRRMAMEALAQVPLCVDRDEQEDPARPRGRVLIWDVEENDVSIAHGCLPPELRLQSIGEPCTVYLITERVRTHSLDYEYSYWSGGGGQAGVKGFTVDLVVCAVDLPSGQPRGRYRIDGNGPPTMTFFEDGVKEIEENWAPNLKRWIDVCVNGPAPPNVSRNDRPWYDKADAARKAIADCERMGSLPTLGQFPRDVAIYNLQTDHRHPASDFVVGLSSLDDEELLMIVPLEQKVVTDRKRGFGRIDTRVALVAFPGAEPLGAYVIKGESWPLPENTGQSWAYERNSRNPNHQITRWVHDLIGLKRGVPQGTIAAKPGETQLAGTDWLKGPGWKLQSGY
jgi:hypothetical protein